MGGGVQGSGRALNINMLSWGTKLKNEGVRLGFRV